MEHAKRKNDTTDLRRYWRFFIPLAFILCLMVKFPLRIVLGESFWDMGLYGTISLICLAVAIRLYRRFGKIMGRITAVIVLCSLLSGWQVFDLAILRTTPTAVLSFGPVMSPDFTELDGLAWYNLRFPSHDIQCHSLYERYFGNYTIAITLEIKRDATWFACGG